MKVTLGAVLCMAAALLWATTGGKAATPADGTLSIANPTLSFTGGPFFASNPTANATDDGLPLCSEATPCDDFQLTVDVPAGYDNAHNIEVLVSWPVSKADFDLFILKASDSTKVTDAATSADPELATFPALAGQYIIRIAPFAPAGQSYSATARLVDKPTTAPPNPPGPGTPRFQNYPALGGLGGDAGEPSIGVNWQTGKAFFLAGFEALRVTFDDCSSPARNTWEDKSPPAATSLDPIMFTDHMRAAGNNTPNRTLVSQLTGQDSITFFTDDDGESWLPSQGGGIPSGVDHQTIGAGPFNENASPQPPPHPSYPNAVYYCSQESVTAFCARSNDGGATFGPGVPIYTTECGGIHGHVKVAPDGTAYVPDKNCGGKAGVARSTDNGVTWDVKVVPTSSASGFLVDPSVGIATDGTIYLGYQAADGNPHIAVSHTKGETWEHDTDVGVAFGLKNSTFPEVVAGDPLRASYAFLGTTVEGNYTEPTTYPANSPWHLYVATTFDGGVSYTVVDATPDDPVQRGTICNLGTKPCMDHSDAGIPDRNLLDFNDITVDKEGRVLVGYADGCIGQCISDAAVTDPKKVVRTSLATISRQSGGKRLFAAFDPNPAEPVAPPAPRVNSVAREGSGNVHLDWSEPDNGGSAITGYNIYRRTENGTYGAPLVTLSAAKTTYDDLTADATLKYYYEVKAINAIGEGTNCGEFLAEAAPDPCTPPGVQVLADPSNDGVVGFPTAQPPYDIQAVAISEPWSVGADKLVFTIKMRDLSTLPPDSRWPVQFKSTDTKTYVVAMITDAAGQVSFKYGEGTTSTASPANTADPLSTYSASGLITIVVPRSGVGNPSVGQKITDFLMRATAGALTPDNAPDGLVPVGEYTIVGNAACRPNAAPIAALTANPGTGIAPLKVNFNASGSSDPDTDAPADTIASYTFDFGDGSTPVTQSSPTIMHTYSNVGNYEATVQVTDSRGKASAGVASVVIEVKQVALTSFTLSPTTVFGGCDQGSRGTVTLNAPAPSGGTVVMLSSSNTDLATVAAGIRVPAGAASYTFPVRTKWVNSNQSVNITATLGTVSLIKPLALKPGNIGQLTLSPNPVTGGNSAVGTVSLQCRAPEGGIVVNLLSTNPAVANLAVQSVTVAAGTKNKQFVIRTTRVTAPKTPTIKATMNGKSTAAVLKVNPQ